MLQLINKTSEYGALPRIEPKGLRGCQYDAEENFEKTIKQGYKKALAILATGSGKTYLACLAAYRLLNYTKTGRVLFLADRNNLARQAQTEFNLFDRTEKQQALKDLYTINRLTGPDKINGDIRFSLMSKTLILITPAMYRECCFMQRSMNWYYQTTITKWVEIQFRSKRLIWIVIFQKSGDS